MYLLVESGVNFVTNYCLFRWAFQKDDGSEHAEVVTMCCALKPMASWNLEEVVSVSRERCGGQVGYSGYFQRYLEKPMMKKLRWGAVIRLK